MIALSCALCGKNQKLTTLYTSTLPKKIDSLKFSARKTPDRIHYQLVKCNSCGLIFSNPILSPRTIARLYKESSYIYLNHLPYLQKTYLELFNHAIPHNLQFPNGIASPAIMPRQSAGHQRDRNDNYQLKVLDIGSSNGFFLEALYNLGYKKVYGVEPSYQEVKNAPLNIRKNIKVDVFKKNQFPKNSFDVVSCFHTLDHVVAPNYLLKNVHNILNLNGLAIFVVHDTEGLSVKLFKEKSPIFDLQHIYLFNKKNLKLIFEKNHLKVLEIKNLKNTFSLDYWLTMSPLPNFLAKIAQKTLKLLNLEKKALSLPAGNIAIIAKKSENKEIAAPKSSE